MISRIDINDLIDAQETFDDAAIGMILDFFIRTARLQRFFRPGVINGELINVLAANKVDSGVANMRKIEFVVHDDDGRRGRAHIMPSGICDRFFEDTLIGRTKRLHQGGNDIISVFEPLLKKTDDGVDGEGAGPFPSLMSTDAIGNDGDEHSRPVSRIE